MLLMGVLCEKLTEGTYRSLKMVAASFYEDKHRCVMDL